MFIFRNWNAMHENTKWIVQFHSPTGWFIHIEEQCFLADKLKLEYIKAEDGRHFIVEELSDLVWVVQEKYSQ